MGRSTRLPATRSSSGSAPVPLTSIFPNDVMSMMRARPAETPLVGAGAPPRPARLVVVDTLPAVLRPEHRAQVLHARVKRAGTARPAPLIRIEWKAQEVVVAVGLAGEFGR